MRAIQITGPGGPEVLKLTDLPAPEPAAGQVGVNATMIGVNFTDLFARIMAQDKPVVPGVEVVGTVASVGADVSDVSVGQRVIAAPLYSLGGYAERVVADASHVLPIPDGVSDEAAAAIALNYGTAYAALHHCARIQPGETVVIHAAAGGVGTAAVQLARLVPDTFLIGTASAAKHDYLRSQGVHETIDYRSGDWEAEIRANHPDGVDLILDGVGESGFARSIGLLRFGGRVVGYGLAAIVPDDHTVPEIDATIAATTTLEPFLTNSTGFIGCHLGAPAPLFRQWISHLLTLCADGAITPHIDRVFPLAEAADAHRYLHQRLNVGKLLLQP
ncbi:MAG TPA: zinc-binding dehydrogenase [Streptosporangiaceae bacterium]|nr:zinc-binding dehydrogenase [Streptosporangiaceae bacterium]